MDDQKQQEALDQLATRLVNAVDTWRKKEQLFKAGQILALTLAADVMRAQQSDIRSLEARVMQLEQHDGACRTLLKALISPFIAFYRRVSALVAF